MLLLSAGLLAGCAAPAVRPAASPAAPSSSPDAPALPLPPSWVAHADVLHGFSIGTPASWDSVTRDSPTIDADLSTVGEHSPQLRAYFQAALDSTPDLRLVAADPRSVSTGFAANINVTTAALTSGPRAPTLQELATAKLARLRGEPSVTGPRRAAARLAGHEAARFDYSLAVGPVSVAVRSYLLVTGAPGARTLVELTMGAPGDNASTFDSIAATFSTS